MRFSDTCTEKVPAAQPVEIKDLPNLKREGPDDAEPSPTPRAPKSPHALRISGPDRPGHVI